MNLGTRIKRLIEKHNAAGNVEKVRKLEDALHHLEARPCTAE